MKDTKMITDYSLDKIEETRERTLFRDTHLDYYRERIRYWVQFFGLLEWELTVTMESLGVSSNGPTCATRLRYWVDSRLATIILNSNWVNEVKDERYVLDELNRWALHETLHLVLANFSEEATKRFAREDVLNREEEAIVMRLERTFFRELYCSPSDRSMEDGSD